MSRHGPATKQKSALECAQFEKSHLIFFVLIIVQIKEEIIIFSNNPAHDADVYFKKGLSESYDEAMDEIDQLKNEIAERDTKIEEITDMFADCIVEQMILGNVPPLMSEYMNTLFDEQEIKNFRIRALIEMGG